MWCFAKKYEPAKKSDDATLWTIWDAERTQDIGRKSQGSSAVASHPNEENSRYKFLRTTFREIWLGWRQHLIDEPLAILRSDQITDRIGGNRLGGIAMVLLGHVRNGMIVADTPVELPEGASVRIELLVEDSPPPQPLPRQGGQYAGQIWMAPDFDEWPPDLQEALGMTP